MRTPALSETSMPTIVGMMLVLATVLLTGPSLVPARFHSVTLHGHRSTVMALDKSFGKENVLQFGFDSGIWLIYRKGNQIMTEMRTYGIQLAQPRLASPNEIEIWTGIFKK